MVQKVGITDTTLRDGHQSLLATRMKTEDMLPIARKMDRIGFHSLEVWGGATLILACGIWMKILGEATPFTPGFSPYQATDVAQRSEFTRIQTLC